MRSSMGELAPLARRTNHLFLQKVELRAEVSLGLKAEVNRILSVATYRAQAKRNRRCFFAMRFTCSHVDAPIRLIVVRGRPQKTNRK
jgi:hypothetical protein